MPIDLPGDGVYGISLVATNGHGNGGTAPAKGDVPNWWVEVDTTKPAAQLLAVRAGTGDDGNMILINWTAGDKNLKPEPVDLYYSSQKDGAWQPIAKGITNTGTYRWAMPQGIGQEIYVRMEVSDRAGNVARCDVDSAGGAGLLASQGPRARHLREQRRGHVPLRQLSRRGRTARDAAGRMNERAPLRIKGALFRARGCGGPTAVDPWMKPSEVNHEMRPLEHSAGVTIQTS